MFIYDYWKLIRTNFAIKDLLPRVEHNIYLPYYNEITYIKIQLNVCLVFEGLFMISEITKDKL